MPDSMHLLSQSGLLRDSNKHKILESTCSGDQAETFMMRVTRGSGIAGLAGIAEASWASFGNLLVHHCITVSL